MKKTKMIKKRCSFKKKKTPRGKTPRGPRPVGPHAGWRVKKSSCWAPKSAAGPHFFFSPLASRPSIRWLIRSPELWINWSMDWYSTG